MKEPKIYSFFLSLFRFLFAIKMRLTYLYLRLKGHFFVTSTIQVHIRARTFDKDGKETFNTGWIPSKSLVIQFLEIIYSALASETLDIAELSGVDDSWLYSNLGRMNVTSGQVGGIMVGIGGTAPTNEDYCLETPIDHGVGAGQLQYGGQNFTLPAVVGPNVDLILSRTVTNGSGLTINIVEVGFYIGENGATLKPRLGARDLLSIEILDTASATVEYRIRTTV